MTLREITKFHGNLIYQGKLISWQELFALLVLLNIHNLDQVCKN